MPDSGDLPHKLRYNSSPSNQPSKDGKKLRNPSAPLPLDSSTTKLVNSQSHSSTSKTRIEKKRAAKSSGFNLFSLFWGKGSKRSAHQPTRKADSGNTRHSQPDQTFFPEQPRRLDAGSSNYITTPRQNSSRRIDHERSPQRTDFLPPRSETPNGKTRLSSEKSKPAKPFSLFGLFQPRRKSSRSLTMLRSEAPTRLENFTRLENSTRPQRSPSRPDNHSGRNTAQPGAGKVTDLRRRSKTRSRHLTPARPRSRSVSAVLYIARMVILSVGVGVLAGTILSAWDPASRAPAGASQQVTKLSATTSAALVNAIAPTQFQNLGQEMAPLKTSIQSLAAQTPQVTPGAFFLDLDNNSYVDFSGSNTFAAASTIKVPVLVAFFQDVDAGKIQLEEALTMRPELIGGGSGEMQYQPPGTKFTALETATKMIVISDNTATNMLIARLGGIAALNQRFKSWGLTTTTINNLLPDLEGTNLTSPKEMALLMARVSQGDLVSIRSRDRMLDIMRKTVTNTLLPRGLGEGATISHKTGDIGTMVGDVGLIDMPNGKRYAATVLVKRSFNDSRAQELIRQISRTTYDYLNRSQNQGRSANSQQDPAAER